MNPITLDEQSILDLLCLGKTNKDIAQILNFQRTKVQRLLLKIFDKLEAENRTQAVAKTLAPHLFKGKP